MEMVSRDRVTLSPEPMTTEESLERTKPMTDDELKPRDYPVGEGVNIDQVIAPNIQQGSSTAQLASKGPPDATRVDTLTKTLVT